ncbi:hypothetical protein PRIPAC_88150 [Pristionchus pacificus]|uniref:Uncharacterized protein n=1 Tax=Pristionchus pacificus TaxID=54126 RepID=A0A2A6B3S0_PRIPA|nr:hypothetical protein PRIPAC_88150 [Pristionchus pacificus]|eukprot:PDM60503.1 hypothetical protein PRIPAC_53481 [Pristionchus pacificus]
MPIMSSLIPDLLQTPPTLQQLQHLQPIERESSEDKRGPPRIECESDTLICPLKDEEVLQLTDAWSWVRSMLEPLPEKGYDNDTERGNRTFDVFCANCVANYDKRVNNGKSEKIACIRAATVAFLGVLTAGIAIGRVFSLHATRRLSPLKLFLYYLLVMHLAAGEATSTTRLETVAPADLLRQLWHVVSWAEIAESGGAQL